MVQARARELTSPSLRRRSAASIWGMGAAELHEAYWRSWGVQCITRGQRRHLSRAAELFLLIEPGQMVLFDLPALVDRLVWHKAAMIRVRVADQEGDGYGERVITDERGLVQRIERRYQPRTRASYRVLLTPRRRLAELWMAAPGRRQGWDAVRGAVPWSRSDHARCPGGCFSEGHPREEAGLISRLVARWHDPGQVIEGITEVAPGVWAARDENVAGGAVLMGPLWIGRGDVDDDACLVGPDWKADGAATADGTTAVRVRRIDEVELAAGRRPRGAPRARPGGYAGKRAFDLAVSLVFLVAALPLFLAVALCILIQDGRPIFYGHVRQTRGGVPFRCWKFRTMCRDADKLAGELADRNICDGRQVFIRDDPRVSRLGHVLRRFQVDELPQFWNVVLGQMSLVGPRPSPDDENQLCPAWRDLRLSVRPGITGLWQIRRTRAPGRDFQEWIRWDIEYVRHASFGLDLKICVQTVWALVTGGRPACG